MKKNIFDYKNYKSYLLELINSKPRRGRGVRSELAVSIGCPVSHISQVLKGSSHFSAEQAHGLNESLGHSQEESEFFLLLIQFARAGTSNLRRFSENQINRVLERRLILKDRLEVKNSLNKEDQAVFYSSWHYQAIHIMLTVERLQTKEALSKCLNLSVKKVSEILDFLISIGLVIQEKGRFRVGTTRIHLGNDSPMISKHHINWRIRAIHSLDSESRDEDLHYSSVISTSEEDFLKIKTMHVKHIEAIKDIIRDSKPEEEVLCFSLDFFRL